MRDWSTKIVAFRGTNGDYRAEAWQDNSHRFDILSLGYRIGDS